MMDPKLSASPKFKFGEQNNDEWSSNLAGTDEKASFKYQRIIIKTLAKLYAFVSCHHRLPTIYGSLVHHSLKAPVRQLLEEGLQEN